jgi:hypothetical protein
MGNTVEVKKYKSEREFERDAEKMMKKGWHIEGQSTRTKKWSLTTGSFTNKGITTVTWLKGPIPQAVPEGAVARIGGGGVTLLLMSVPEEKEVRKRINHLLAESEGLVAHGFKPPTSSLGFRERVQRLVEISKVVKVVSEGTSQVVGPYEAATAESIASELRQAGATVEIEARAGLPSASGGGSVRIDTPDSPMTRLKQLAELREAGIVTEQEFESKKVELLSRV